MAALLSGCGTRTDPETEESPAIETPVVANESESEEPSDDSAAPIEPEADEQPEYFERFDRIVDAVEDLGVDPTGEEPVNEAFFGAGSNVLITLPDGHYSFEGESRLTGIEKFGIHGSENTTIVLPEDTDDRILDLFEIDEIAVTNLDVDQRAMDAVGAFRIQANEWLYVGNIQFHGRALRRDGYESAALNVGLRSETGTGRVESVVSKKGSAWSHYNNSQGRIGVYTGRNHRGTIELIDLDLREFGNNALYCSRTLGDVQVIGGYFENNNVGSVRISGDGSFVDGATIVIDPDRYTGPRTREDRSFAMRPIVIEQATNTLPMKPAGCEVRNCRIVVKENPAAMPAIHVYPNGRSLRITDTEIEYEASGRPVILRDEYRNWGRSGHPPGEPPRHLELENVTVTGEADDTAVRIVDGDGSEIKNCRFVLRGPGANGIEIRSSENCRIQSTTLKVDGEPTVFDDVEPEVNDLQIERLQDETKTGEPVTKGPPIHIS